MFSVTACVCVTEDGGKLIKVLVIVLHLTFSYRETAETDRQTDRQTDGLVETSAHLVT